MQEGLRVRSVVVMVMAEAPRCGARVDGFISTVAFSHSCAHAPAGLLQCFQHFNTSTMRIVNNSSI